MTTDPIPDISILLKQLGAAIIELREASQEGDVSRNRQMSAHNGLNAAQRGIDRWYELQKKDASEDSDWARAVTP